MFNKGKCSEELRKLINKEIKTGKLLKIVFISENKYGNTDKVEIDVHSLTMITLYSNSYNEKIKEKKYRLTKLNIFHLKKLIKKYNLPGWSNLPMGDLLALDSPIKSLILYYDNSKVGGSHLDCYSINFYSRIPKDGFLYLNIVIDYILSLKKRNKTIEE